MPKNRYRVVVAIWRRRFRVGARPFLAVSLRDLANLCFIESRPALEECRKHFPPVVARARFDTQIIVEIAQMNGSGFAECHFRRHFAIGVASALPVIFQKLGQLRFGHAEM